MNKTIIIISLLLGTLLFACNDGNLEVETISFNNTDVLSCTSDTTATFLFKYNQKQALILTLPVNSLENREKTVSGTIPTNYRLYYRTFSEAVNNSYFCNNIPPATPVVTSQIEASGGTVSVTSQPIYDENTGNLLRYDHLIRISDLVLVNSKGDKVVDSNFIFGTYRTTR